jgi:hypothetical protein
LYQLEPTQWKKENHPYFCECTKPDEVRAVTKYLYGLETLQRVGLCVYTCAEPKIKLYAATASKSYLEPTFSPEGNPFLLDQAVSALLRP